MSNKVLLKSVVAFGLLAMLLLFLGVNYIPRIAALSPDKEESASASKNANTENILREPSAYAVRQVRIATADFRNDVPAALAAGYQLLPSVGNCFDNPGVGGMGYHYIDAALLDSEIDPLKPEALVYDYNRVGKLQLVAVEYIVPINAWDSAHSQPPSLDNQTFSRDPSDGTYSLHAWIWQLNPSGMFSDWNPDIKQCRLEPPHHHPAEGEAPS
jgi:hypothetical protein